MKLKLFCTSALIICCVHSTLHSTDAENKNVVDLPFTQPYPALQTLYNQSTYRAAQLQIRPCLNGTLPSVILDLIAEYAFESTYPFLSVPTTGCAIFTTFSQKIHVLISPTTLLSVRVQKNKPSKTHRQKAVYRTHKGLMKDIRISCTAYNLSGHSLIPALQKKYLVPTYVSNSSQDHDGYLNQINTSIPVPQDEQMYVALCKISLLFASKDLSRKQVFSPTIMTPALARAPYLVYQMQGLE